MDTFEGHLLIASPQLGDENFARSLVLLIEHNQEGAFGVVLNRPIGKTLQELWREVGSAPCHSRQPVYLGGPVPGPLMSLHTTRALAETEPVPGVFFAARKQHLDKLVLSESPAYKVFIGHAGWGAGQLENESAKRLADPARHRRADLLHRRRPLGNRLPPIGPVADQVDAPREGPAGGPDGELTIC